MEFTNDNLKKMYFKHNTYNIKYSKYFYRLYKEFNNKNFIRRQNEVMGCMTYWEWAIYYKNMIMDLQKVNRCKNRFCPNCKLLDISKFIHKFKYILEENMKDYNFYFLTLTIPSCGTEDLDDTLLKLNKSFAKFKELYSYPKFTPSGKKSKKALQNRLIDIAGGIRVLEITYNYINGFHPHYHIFIMTKDKIPQRLLQKKHIARYSKKRKEIDLKSDIEKEISIHWAEVWYNTTINKNDYNLSNTYFNEEKGYKILEVDFREFDERGIYETLKYTVKDNDIVNYDVFKTLYFALYGKRLRQGFGVLYDLKIDDTDLECGVDQELILDIDEEPIELITKGIKELYTTYAKYKKISRYTVDDNVKDD